VLREQGPAALKAQLGETRPFITVLFEREKTLETLETPESYAGLKVRLRKLAAAIADHDLSQMYREALFDQFEALRQLSRPAATASAADRALAEARWSGKGAKRKPPLTGPSPEGKAAAHRLRRALKPSSATIAAAVLNHPDFVEVDLERFEVQGFGDETLEGLAKEIIRLRLSFPSLDSASLGRHLAGSGFSEILAEIGRAAASARASFLQPDITEERARADWSLAYAQTLHLAHLERAIEDAKSEAEIDFEVLGILKTERDGLKRRIKAGEFDSVSDGFAPAY
jgi:DNA primase